MCNVVCNEWLTTIDITSSESCEIKQYSIHNSAIPFTACLINVKRYHILSREEVKGQQIKLTKMPCMHFRLQLLITLFLNISEIHARQLACTPQRFL